MGPNIGIAAKLTKLEWDQYRLGESYESLLLKYEKEGMDVKSILASHNRQKSNLESIVKAYPDAEIMDFLSIENGELPQPEYDLVISVGGDNFFQHVAHLFPYSTHLGVNSDPETSFGSLLINPEEAIAYSKDIFSDNYQISHWTRIATYLNNERLPDALCTVSLSIKATDMISRYLLSKGDRSEEQKCTGLLVVTGAGSDLGSWYHNAGLYLYALGKARNEIEFSTDVDEIRSLTREPFNATHKNYDMLNESVYRDETLKLTYWSNDPSELSLDSIKRYEVKEGDTLEFKISDSPLEVII